MKKRILSMLLTVVMVTSLLAAFPVNVSAVTNSGTCGPNVTWSVAGSTLTISGTGNMYSWYDGIPPWYSEDRPITDIIIKYGVTDIGDAAFGKLAVRNVSIPSSVTRIGVGAFVLCDNLSYINIPYGVTSIGKMAFYGCDSLSSINIPETVRTIGDYAFRDTYLDAVYYGGSKAQWNAISIGKENNGIEQNLWGTTIYYNCSVGVHKTDISTLANNIETNLNSLLSSITLCDTTINGPTFDVAGYDFCPIKIPVKAVLDFSKLPKNITIDEDNKKVNVILGKKNKKGEASVVQTTKTCDSTWSKQYNEIKDLYRSMTGLTPSGSDRNGVNNWNKFEKLKGQLNRMDCDLFVKASMECVAYLEFDYQTGYLRFSEGGFIQKASLGVDFNYPVLGKFVYTTIGLTGAEQGVIKASVSSSGVLNPYISLEPSLTAKAEITGEIKPLGKVTGGVDATLAVLLQNLDPKLTVTMRGNIYLYAKVLNYTLVDLKEPYLGVQLYPEFKELTLMSLGNTYNDIYEDAFLTPRDYLNGISLFSLNNENAIYEQKNVYPDNEAQLVDLPGNSMMLVWTGDDGSKSDINRSSLMYSIYENGEWSEVSKIAEDGTATGYFKVVGDGSKVYIVFQKLSHELSDDTLVTDMLMASDLYMVKYEKGIFTTPIKLNDYENTAYEFITDVYLENDDLKVLWIENSNNDIFLSSGISTIKMCDIKNGVIGENDIIAEHSAEANQYLGDTQIVNDKIYYTLYSISGETTTADLYLYSDGNSERVMKADSISNVKNIGNALYYIRNSKIYKLENGIEEDLGFENITSFEIVSNGTKYSMLMAVSNGSKNEIYISNLIDGNWSYLERFTDLNKYIKSYSPFMYNDGTINLAVSAAEVNDDIESEESIYGNTTMMVLTQCDYFDISTSYIYYEETEILPDNDVDFYFDVVNDSSKTLSSVTVTLTDDSGNEIEQQIIDCEIEPFATETLSIKYHLPQNIGKTKISLTISSNQDEKDYSNNTVSTEFGYANISVSPISCVLKKDNTAELNTSIENTGFCDAENVILKVYDGSISNEVLVEKNIGTLQKGRIYEFDYTFPAERMVSINDDVMNAVYVVVETTSSEALYSDNEQKVVFDSLLCKIDDIEINDTGIVVDFTKNFDQESILIVTSYSKENKLLDIKYTNVNSTDKIDISLNTTGAANVSAFLWNNDMSLEPFCTSFRKTVE